MKKREIAIIVALLVLLVIGGKLAFGVNEAQQPKDLRDFLVQPPNSVYQAYGYSEETQLLYNLIDLRAICINQEARIKALELQVAELVEIVELIHKPRIIDPND